MRWRALHVAPCLNFSQDQLSEVKSELENAEEAARKEQERLTRQMNDQRSKAAAAKTALQAKLKGELADLQKELKRAEVGQQLYGLGW